MSKVAIVLFNLGGPDGPDAVPLFLFNLFNDPAIIGLPNPFRWLLAKLISKRRAPTARAIYDHIGGKSPLLELTNQQAEALGRQLDDDLGGDPSTRVFVAMRYWHPMSDAVAAEVAAYDPDDIVLLPLYPQFSTTTTGSSVADWHRAAAAVGLGVPTRVICCYPSAGPFIEAHASAISDALARASESGRPRLLFSAHGLPRKIVAAGDPYAWQVEQTAAAVLARIGNQDLDWLVCYQSRVGPLEWIGPATEDELKRAGADGVPVVVVPIAFVSEHSETLVELDIEYRQLAEEAGVPAYVRVPALGTATGYIDTLAEAVRDSLARDVGTCAATGQRICPRGYGRCPMAA